MVTVILVSPLPRCEEIAMLCLSPCIIVQWLEIPYRVLYHIRIYPD